MKYGSVFENWLYASHLRFYIYIYNTENDEPVDLGAILRQNQLVVFPKKIEEDNPGCYTG